MGDVKGLAEPSRVRTAALCLTIGANGLGLQMKCEKGPESRLHGFHMQDGL